MCGKYRAPPRDPQATTPGDRQRDHQDIIQRYPENTSRSSQDHPQRKPPSDRKEMETPRDLHQTARRPPGDHQETTTRPGHQHHQEINKRPAEDQQERAADSQDSTRIARLCISPSNWRIEKNACNDFPQVLVGLRHIRDEITSPQVLVA